jgi:hypothetical protein
VPTRGDPDVSRSRSPARCDRAEPGSQGPHRGGRRDLDRLTAAVDTDDTVGAVVLTARAIERFGGGRRVGLVWFGRWKQDEPLTTTFAPSIVSISATPWQPQRSPGLRTPRGCVMSASGM